MVKRKREPQWHTLNVQCDDEKSCALTAYLPHSRVHVIADATKLDRMSKLGADYRDLVQKFRNQGDKVPIQQNKSSTSGGRDSGVDLEEYGAETEKSNGSKHDLEDPENALLSWILCPLLANQEKRTPSKKVRINQTLQDWYRCSTEFYELAISSDDDDTLEAIELEPTKDLEKVVNDILPSVTLPKSLIEDLDVLCFHASELQVLQCSDQPPGTPYHPCRVRHRENKKTYFLKVVDNAQPKTTKRELDVLGRITKLKLDKKMRVPILEGLVSFDDVTSAASGRRKIMGFLQTEIPNPTPLTNLLDSSIPQKKRKRWAKEADELKSTLHEHDIIWGDAKADNFMVDDEDNLWIIDFGGSYTEGWVDPHLKETEEGDDQGKNKTIYALKDPKACTYDTEEDEKKRTTQSQNRRSGRKRKADHDDNSVKSEKSRSRKRQRS